MTIFVGNISDSVTERELQDLFTPFGAINSVKIITDAFTRRSKGFGFVDMAGQDEAASAIAQLNNTQLHGQPLTVNPGRRKN